MNNDEKVIEKTLWKNEPNNETVIKQLKTLALDHTVSPHIREIVNLASTRLAKLDLIAKNTIADIQGDQPINNQLKTLIEHGFDRHELVREYGYSKKQAAFAEKTFAKNVTD